LTGFSLDHIGIGVSDLDAALAQFRRLGFQLTPRGYHTTSTPGGERRRLGTANHCAMLRRGYLELIGIVDPGYQGRLRADLARRQGIHIVAFGTADAVAAADALRASGIKANEPWLLERPIEEQEESRLARFRIVEFPEENLPEAHFFAIQHLTADLLWKPALLSHPNGAQSLDSLTVATVDPAGFARRLGRVLRQTAGGEAVVFKLANSELHVVDLDWIGAYAPNPGPALSYVAGLSLGVSDVEETAQYLAGNLVPFTRTAEGLMVPPSDACGAFIEFRAERS
jgi:catechol 2,3-dioxygenase-like lactoylglutathione lyase family enzyme